MRILLIVTQILSAILLVGTILIQSRGTGFTRGSPTSFTRRGLEKLVFRFTFLIAAIFIIVSILQIVI